MPENLDETAEIHTEPAKKEKVHLVRRGDTISSISKKYKVSVNDLKKWNGIKNSKLKPGMKLKIHV
jgi:LysM repeat protein